ncbi:6-phosphofructokinase [Pasteurella bettyae]|uniref:6-phosphofructokinase n=1 Tax=Pasteurella bettyae TaxID=752 RepID=UPI003D283B24
MKKYFIFVLIGLLTGCVNTKHVENLEKQPHLVVPKEINHNAKTYYLKAQRDLGSMSRYVYFEKKETPTNWKSEIEVLHDVNAEKRSLEEREKLREKVYNNTGVEHFQLFEKDHSLYSFVIYAPSAQYNNWQVNVAKGENAEGCGFVQYQYALKIPKTKKLMNMGKVKLIGYLKKYAVDKEMQRISSMEWNWVCKVNNKS